MIPADAAPTITPRNVPNSRIPLPHDRRAFGRISGSNPYFDGPKSADCVLAKKTAANSRLRFCQASPATASSITATSPDGNCALAVAVRQVAPAHRKENIRDGEESPNHQHQAIPVSLLQPHPQDEEDDQLLEAVLVQSTLELGGNEHPEPALPATFAGICGEIDGRAG